MTAVAALTSQKKSQRQRKEERAREIPYFTLECYNSSGEQSCNNYMYTHV